MNNKSGFTLIEVLIAMVVSLIIMGGAYMFFNSQQRQTTIQTNVSDAQQTLRAAMDFMSRDIRMAGYDPDPNDAINFVIGNERVDIDGDGTYELNAISDINGMSAIAFTWNNTSGLPSRYYIDDSTVAPDSKALMFNGQPLAGYIIALGLAYAYDNNGDGQLDRDSAGELIWAVSNNKNWDGITVDQEAGTVTTTATGTAVDLRKIRAIRIWMLSQSQAPDPNYTDSKTYVVGPHVVTPNNSFRHRLLERTILCRNMGL